MVNAVTLAEATPIVEKLGLIVPEIVLFVGACVVMMLGLSPSHSVRKACVPFAVLSLIAAGVMAAITGGHVAESMAGHPFPQFVPYAKGLVAIVGIILVMGLAGTVDVALERSFQSGRQAFEAIRTNRGEFYAFFLFSLCGLMLCASADDLIWLFLALELTSLPTYVMVAISTARTRSQEAGVKYFFLGAFGAATFLLGFAMLYGLAGTTLLFGDAGVPTVMTALLDMREASATAEAAGGIGTLATIGLVLSVIGLCFKIAAVPMHFYTADVYQGAAPGVTAMLAFVPKAAGIFALVLLLGTVGWDFGVAGSSLPTPIRELLWVLAAVTMVVGNVLALLQSSVKRMLAYSSVAHSGYMLVGLIAGPAIAVADNGVAATLFYLLCYGCMNPAAFLVLASLERRGESIETVDDLRGLCAGRPLLGYSMVLGSLSLLGLPPLLGFWGKLHLFTSAVSAGEIALVVLLGVTSAIAAFYYLRLAGAPFLEDQSERERDIRLSPAFPRVAAAVLSAGSVVALALFTTSLMRAAGAAGSTPQEAASAEPQGDRITLAAPE
ncbi:MAG: NADH-quinone oxidoreductase subunit N [Planctomycetota bacterium]